MTGVGARLRPVADREKAIPVRLEDYELIAQRVSALSEQVSRLDNRVADLLTRMLDVERVNARLEDAALTTSRALAEISGHWDSVYEAMRRKNTSQQAPE